MDRAGLNLLHFGGNGLVDALIDKQGRGKSGEVNHKTGEQQSQSFERKSGAVCHFSVIDGEINHIGEVIDRQHDEQGAQIKFPGNGTGNQGGKDNNKIVEKMDFLHGGWD